MQRKEEPRPLIGAAVSSSSVCSVLAGAVCPSGSAVSQSDIPSSLPSPADGVGELQQATTVLLRHQGAGVWPGCADSLTRNSYRNYRAVRERLAWCSAALPRSEPHAPASCAQRALQQTLGLLPPRTALWISACII